MNGPALRTGTPQLTFTADRADHQHTHVTGCTLVQPVPEAITLT